MCRCLPRVAGTTVRTSRTSFKSASAVLPCRKSKTPPHLTWGPVLAWLILQNLEPGIHPFEVFEKFNLRWALAETFAAVGLEGEAAWKAAAQIRILAKFFGKTADETFRLEAFWTDPDVRWLIGVNNAGGIEYVNQERLEETLIWTYLPELLHEASLSTPRLTLDLVTRFVNRVQLANFEYLRILQFTHAKDPGSSDRAEQSPRW